jgi:hypothetical protein
MGGRDFVAWITAQLTDHLGRGRAYAAYNKRYGAKFGELPINYRRLVRVPPKGAHAKESLRDGSWRTPGRAETENVPLIIMMTWHVIDDGSLASSIAHMQTFETIVQSLHEASKGDGRRKTNARPVRR